MRSAIRRSLYHGECEETYASPGGVRGVLSQLVWCHKLTISLTADPPEPAAREFHKADSIAMASAGCAGEGQEIYRGARRLYC